MFFFPFNGKRKAHSLAIVISQRRTSAGTERYRIYSTGTGNNGVLSAGNNVDIVRAVSDFASAPKQATWLNHRYWQPGFGRQAN